jgi:hypothetical protein
MPLFEDFRALLNMVPNGTEFLTLKISNLWSDPVDREFRRESPSGSDQRSESPALLSEYSALLNDLLSYWSRGPSQQRRRSEVRTYLLCIAHIHTCMQKQRSESIPSKLYLLEAARR